MRERGLLENGTGNWKTKMLVIGAAAGAVVGVATAYLLARTAEENRGGPPQVSTGDVVKAVLGVAGVMRGIAALGD